MIKQGSSEWFSVKRSEIALHIRALANFKAAEDAADLLASKWSNLDPAGTEAGALFMAAIVSYARPFTKTVLPASGGKNGVYSLKYLKGPGFDRTLHDHLIVLRHKLLAHTDADIFPSSVLILNLGLTFEGGGTAVIPAGAVAASYSLQSTDSLDRVNSLIAQFKGCADNVNAIVQAKLAEWLGAVRRFPEEYAAYFSNCTLPPISFKTDVRPIAEAASPSMPMDAFMAGIGRRPDPKVDQDHYIYRTNAAVFVPNDIRLSFPTGEVVQMIPFQLKDLES